MVRLTLVFLVGAEYEVRSLKSISGDDFIHGKDISAFAGFALPLGYRIWGSYIFSSQIPDGKGTGYKVGISSRLLFLLSMNLEYASRKYTTYKGPSLPTGSTYRGTDDSVKLSFSFPLNF